MSSPGLGNLGCGGHLAPPPHHQAYRRSIGAHPRLSQRIASEEPRTGWRLPTSTHRHWLSTSAHGTAKHHNTRDALFTGCSFPQLSGLEWPDLNVYVGPAGKGKSRLLCSPKAHGARIRGAFPQAPAWEPGMGERLQKVSYLKKCDRDGLSRRNQALHTTPAQFHATRASRSRRGSQNQTYR